MELLYGTKIFNEMMQNIGVFFLCFARIFAFILTTPLLATQAVPRIAKIALALLVTALIFPQAFAISFSGDVFSAGYLLLLIGEALLGVLTGFFVTIIFSVFGTAGQFFSYQMGFSASSVYDSLSQVENPLMSQYLNFLAILVFIQVNGFQKLFLGGLLQSIQSINCFLFLQNQEAVASFFLKLLSLLFYYGFIIAMPIVGTLFLIHVGMGLLTKAAPQMNLLAEGFPITILLTFILLFFLVPQMMNFFEGILDASFVFLHNFFIDVGARI